MVRFMWGCQVVSFDLVNQWLELRVFLLAAIIVMANWIGSSAVIYCIYKVKV